jgi:hypothetical protein
MKPSRDAIIGIIALIVIIIVLAWFAVMHPPMPAPAGDTSGMGTSTATGPLHTIAHGEFYDVDLQYPSSTLLAVSAGNTADTNAVAVMKAYNESLIPEFEQTFTGISGDYLTHLQQENLKGSLTTEYSVYESAHTVSYVFQIFSDTLGAHPNTTYKTFTFDTATGKLLDIKELFAPGANYLSTLHDLAATKLPGQIAAAEQVDVAQIDAGMLDAGITPTDANFSNFYFDGSNFVLLFPPYQVGPYVLGLVTLSVPSSEVPGLSPQYP